jgi:hypothetical protein
MKRNYILQVKFHVNALDFLTLPKIPSFKNNKTTSMNVVDAFPPSYESKFVWDSPTTEV